MTGAAAAAAGRARHGGRAAGWSPSRCWRRAWRSSTPPPSRSRCRRSAGSSDASLSGLQWTVTGYTLTLASLILLGGSLGDRYGRRRVFVIGVVLVRRRLAALRARPEHRAAGRGPRPAGHRRRAAHPGQPGAHPVLVPARRTAPGRSACGRRWPASPGWSGRSSAGVLVDAVSWRLVFLINVPVAVVIVAVAGRHVPESRDPARARPLRLRSAPCWARWPSAASPTR